ncbi:MAG: methyltransferase domain-containing protein [bacterium]|nr:methyltransferase domain-containing protein [bacterium]
MLKKIKDKLYFIKRWWQMIFCYPQDHIIAEADYDAYWTKRGEDKQKAKAPLLNSAQKKRAEIIAEIIKEDGERKVSILDVGCGDGELLHYLSSMVKADKIIGVDGSPRALELAKKLGILGIEMNVNNKESIEKLPPSDFVLLLEVLEHLPNTEEVLRASFKIAARGVFFSFPNSGYFLFRLRLLFGRFPMQWRVHPGEHLRFWTVGDTRWWLKALQYENYDLRCYRGIPLLGKPFPSLFAEGILVYLPKKQ